MTENQAVAVKDDVSVGFHITNLQDLRDFSKMLASSGMVPKDYVGRPDAIVAGILFGKELGLSPLQSLQNVANINGRPAVWGDGALGLVQATNLLEVFEEWYELDDQVIGAAAAEEGMAQNKNVVAKCKIKRRDRPERIHEFSWNMAKMAGLTGKETPWKYYKSRMLKMRPRGYALRDDFADVLKGLRLAEEMMGETIDVTPGSPDESALQGESSSLASKLKKPQAANTMVEEVTLPPSAESAPPETGRPQPKAEPAKPKAPAKATAKAKPEPAKPAEPKPDPRPESTPPPTPAEGAPPEPTYEKAGIELAKTHKVGSVVTGILSLVSAGTGKKKEVLMMPHESPETTIDELGAMLGDFIRFQYRIQEDANNRPQVWLFDIIPDSRFEQVMAKRAVQEGEAEPEGATASEAPDDFLSLNPGEAYHKG